LATDRSEYVKRWKIENRDKYVAGYKAYTEKTKAKKSEYDRKRREEKRDSILEAKKAYYRQNKDKHAKYQEINKEKRSVIMREWRATHKPEIRTKTREYIKNKLENDDDFAIKYYMRQGFRRMVKDGFTWRYLFNIAGYTYQDYLDYFNANYKDEFEEYRRSKKYHIDHIIPVSAYDFSNTEDIKRCWNPRNLRIISVEENIKKSNKIDFDIICKYGIIELVPIGGFKDD
jgi:hypothetical protein